MYNLEKLRFRILHYYTSMSLPLHHLCFATITQQPMNLKIEEAVD